jgi:arylsulfatase A-like enzyme
MAEAYSGWEEVNNAEFEPLPPPELVRRYRQMTGAPEQAAAPAHWGEARGCDVLVLALETTPQRFLDLSGDLTRFPNMARLRRRAWVAAQHHTTYPSTRRGLFSLLTSWYPSGLLIDFPQRYPRRTFPGFMQGLRRAGYATALYAPDAYTHFREGPMYEQLGVERFFYTEEGTWDPFAQAPPWTEKARRDHIALEALKGDVARWHRQGQRFAALYTPQIGHGPLPDVKGDLPPADVVGRARAVLALEDEWLGEVLDQLDRDKRLEKTLIVLTGDHGVRTRVDDPGFRGGVVRDDSFHVPFLLYAPPARTSRQDVPWLTSHIDLSPSLLDLLGVADGRASEQGSPIWDERLRERTIYFWGQNYLGAHGYRSRQECAMWNYMNDAVYLSDRLSFDLGQALEPGSAAANAVKERIRRMTGLQETWAAVHDGQADPGS